MSRSIVEYYFCEHRSSRCGYCKSSNTNYSHGMWTHTLSVHDYQDLIDRGWRRSGKYCYKPTMDITCCPLYTIRCRALEFKCTKSQKKVLKRLNKYLMGQDGSEQPSSARKMSTGSSDTEHVDEGREVFVQSTREPQNIDITNVTVSNQTDVEEMPKSSITGETLTQMESKSGSETKLIEVSQSVGPDPTKAPCKKAKQIRRERKLEKLKEKGIDVSTLNRQNKNKEKQIEDFINDLPDDVKQKLEIRLVRTTPPSPEWLATAKESHAVYVKYQTVVHNDRPEECTETQFHDFLVKSPLLEEHSETGPECGYGSFHQQYWLDKKLIAVGIIDILPKCISSVYFFYDPQYMNLTLGTYGALREIEFTRKLQTVAPELKYYYMGFYIHSCRKMRYKGNFFPSDLLCPETYQWFPLKDAIPKLEISPYSRLNPDMDAIDENCPTDNDLNYIPVLVHGGVVLYKMYKRRSGKNENDKKEVKEYAGLVGTKLAKRLILVRQTR